MDKVVCNKSGIGNVCCRCDHAREHLPILIDKRNLCIKTDLCTLWIDSTYTEIKVKCAKPLYKKGEQIMSGGHWRHIPCEMKDTLSEVGISVVSKDPDVRKRFKKLAKVLSNLNIELGRIIHNLDWDLSSDEEIENDRKFEEDAIRNLKKCMGKDVY